MRPGRLAAAVFGALAATRLPAQQLPARAETPRPEAAKLDVDVVGLGGVLSGLVSTQSLQGSLVKQNVMSVLSIEAARGDDDLTERRIRRLHAGAPDEIRRALEPFGYYRPTIEASLEPPAPGGKWTARYQIDPGPPIPVTKVEVSVTGEGESDWAFRAAAAGFPVRQGESLRHAEWERGKAAFADAAAERGYLDGEFETAEVRVDLESYTAQATLRYATGPRYLFGPVAFRQDILEPRLLRGYVTWKEGEPLNLNKLLELQNALGDSPYFQRVEVVPARDRARDLAVPIDVALTPAKPQRYRFGLGYGTDTGPRASIDADYRRLNRKGHRAEADIRVSAIEQSFAANYLIPGAYPRTDVWTLTLGYAHLKPETSNTQTALAAANYSFALGRWRQSFFLQFTREDFTVGSDSGIAYLTAPGSDSVLVVADDRIDARDGYRLQGRVTGAARGAGSNASFGQLYASAKRILPLGPKNRLIGRLELGYLVTNDFHALPPRVRFFAGGDTSVRGYAYQSLGERDALGNVIGGRALETASIELERRFLPKWGAAVFLDAGNALDRFTTSVKKGVGAGVRWISPIGPVRVDGAYGLDDPRGLRLHISIGPDL